MDEREVKRPGAPAGNKNASRGAQIRAEIREALARRDKIMHLPDGGSLAGVFDKYIDEVCNGDVEMRNDFFDRLYGKAKQAVELSGDDESPLVIQWPLPRTPLDR